MQFNVPQFIEVKDKIIGPLTLRQFIYLLLGMVVIVILWFYFELWLFVIIIIPIVLVSLMLAFYKFNGRRFIYFISSAMNYMMKPKLYLWKKNDKK